jgi:hypothetical protein
VDGGTHKVVKPRRAEKASRDLDSATPSASDDDVADDDIDDDAEDFESELLTFEDLGVCKWLVESCAAMGIRKPTPVRHHSDAWKARALTVAQVQRCCIPEALRGKDVMGLAETGRWVSSECFESDARVCWAFSVAPAAVVAAAAPTICCCLRRR